MSPAAPEISVVIACVNGGASLAACVEALQRQQGDVDAEVILVAGPRAPGVSDVAGDRHPRVRVIVVDGEPTIPRLRAAGIRAARGELVAITEDHCIPAPDWYEAIRRCHAQRPAAAIGGAVDNAATTRLVDWAVYFCEYGAYASPLPAGPTADLPGPNVSYKRRTLLELQDTIADEYWETFVHDRLARLGHQLWRDPSMQVRHKMHFRFLPFLAERFHYGRAFAGRRNQALGWTMRIVRGTLSPLLVPLFVMRISRNVLARRQHLLRFAACLPMICCFAVAAAAGEAAGHACGAGASAARLR